MTTTPTQQEPKPSHKLGPSSTMKMEPWQFFAFCLVGFASVVITSYTFISLIQGSADYAPKLVAEFSGSGNDRTAYFEVDDAWELRWHHSGRIEKLEWRTEEGKGSMLIDMHRKPIREQGGVNWSKGGVYAVEVTATGEWELQIYQFTN